MKIEFLYSSPKWEEEHEYRSFYEVLVNGKTFISVFDGEPEDANLNRDFNDIYKIPELLKLVIDAMERGEEIIFGSEIVDE